jgi:hypothetical protein
MIKTSNRDYWGESMMLQKIKGFLNQEKVRWTSRFVYYLLILLLLFFMYGFNDASAGSYIYNDF